MDTVHTISLLLQFATFLQGKSTALPAPQIRSFKIAVSESNCGVRQGAVNSNHLEIEHTYPSPDSIYPKQAFLRTSQLPPAAIYCRQRGFRNGVRNPE